MRLLLLPGMDGTGLLFEPLVRALPLWLHPIVAAYPADEPRDYADLLPIVEGAAPRDDHFVVLGESFSGPLALMLAARRPPGLRGVILCASFIRNPLLVPLPIWLVQPLWFRMAPTHMLHWMLLGRFQSPTLRRLLTPALAAAQSAVLAARVRAILSVDVAAELRNCTVPVLYLKAKHDRVVRPSNMGQIRRLRPQTRVATLAGPHLLLQANPEGAAAVIRDFCDCV